MEGDIMINEGEEIAAEISIHSLRVEGDITATVKAIDSRGFQSTPSVWRETNVRRLVTVAEKISIHSLRVEGDCRLNARQAVSAQFQSTPSVWRETFTA